MSEPVKCPDCWGKARVLKRPARLVKGHYKKFKVVCPDADCQLGQYSWGADTKEGAIEAWNRRGA